MAVVQISRIQVRRGQKTVTGLPQLASGELAWAVDTQQLYIGNGSVAEGSPAVGNTQILTERDLSANGTILNLLKYQYKAQDGSITTGNDANHPVSRSIQDRLDDRVSLADFITTDDTQANDYTAPMQRAIDQLFLNSPKASGVYGSVKRVVLEVPAGTYPITDTLYIPSYATIKGAGSQKTILSYTGTGSILTFVNDSSTIGNPNVSATDSTNNPKFISVQGFTLYTATNNTTAININTLTDSVLDDLLIKGTWTSGATGSRGIDLNAVSTVITTRRNTFKNITMYGFECAVFSNADIVDNTFDNFTVGDINDNGVGIKQGFVFGSITLDTGSTLGPYRNVIKNSKFYKVAQQGVYIGTGTGNSVKDCKFSYVGNDSGAPSSPIYPQIYFKQHGNNSINNEFDRQALLTTTTATPYIAEVTGNGEYNSFGTYRVSLTNTGTDTDPTIHMAFRLPVPTTDSGSPTGQVSYIVNYVYHSTGSGFIRQGTLNIAADATLNHTYKQLSDEFNFAGPADPSGFSEYQLSFFVRFLNSNGTTHTGTGSPYSIAVNYLNPLSGDQGTLTFSYHAVFNQAV